MNYSDQVEVRDVIVDGETNWMWIKGDTGAFDGPMDDWLNHHKTNYTKYLTDTDVVVTAGTNCGMYARFYAKMFKHVYAFEPEPIAFHCMVNNCPYDNVVKLNAAVGNGHGIVGIRRAAPGGHEFNVGMNQVVEPTEQYQIPMVTIDSLGLKNCNLIQLDVEGYEQYAIQGAINTIKQFQPVIIAERFGSPAHQEAMERDLNYKFVGMSSMDAVYVHEEKLDNG